ncbi:MAG: HAMP domain-containing sensor histidine kinase [Pseudomonadota bacterium]
MPTQSKPMRVSRLSAIAVGLVTVPLIIIAAMAVRTIVSDKAASKALAIEAAQQVARSYAVQLQTAIVPVVSDRLATLQAALSGVNEPIGFLRRLVHERTPPFVVLIDDERRVYPPEDPSSLLFQERQELAQIESGLSAAMEKTTIQATGSAWAVFLDEPTLITCGHVDTTRVICIASMLHELRQTIDDVLTGQASETRQPVELRDPWDQRRWPLNEPPTSDTHTVRHDLTDSFAGWKIHVDIKAATGAATSPILAIVVPVALGCSLALLALVRFQSGATRQHRMRAESAARLSHDLRTPIANLALYVELIARHGRDNAAVARCCKALEEEIERLAFIADTTVRRSRGLAQTKAISAPVGADEVVANIVSRYKPLMEKSGCTLAFDAGAPAAVVDDKTALERILINLIDNARSHAEGANVKVLTRGSHNDVLLTIVDDGPRTSSNPRPHNSGHGLGLKVVEELAQSRGGTFKAFIQSTGSRFEVVLPSIGAAQT